MVATTPVVVGIESTRVQNLTCAADIDCELRAVYVNAVVLLTEKQMLNSVLGRPVLLYQVDTAQVGVGESELRR